MAVSKRLRFEVLRRDNHTCRYCGAAAPAVKLVVDHVVPETLGGRDEPENLVTACEPCNSGKSSIPPDAAVVADVKQDALRWARAMELARRGELVQREQRDANRDSFLESWNRWTVRVGIKQAPLPLPTDWPLAVDAFFEAGLDEEDLHEAVDQSMRRRNVDDKFRYFCGVAWNMVRQRTEAAAQLAPLIGDEEAQTGVDADPWAGA